MNPQVSIDDNATPALAGHVRWREDKARERWVLMAPERLYVPDDVGRDVLRRLDGQTRFEEIVAQLATEYDAPKEAIATDVRAMLSELIEKGIVEL